MNVRPGDRVRIRGDETVWRVGAKITKAGAVRFELFRDCDDPASGLAEVRVEVEANLTKIGCVSGRQPKVD